MHVWHLLRMMMAEETCLRTPGETSGVIMVGNFPQPTSDQYCVTLECQCGSLAQTALSSRNRYVSQEQKCLACWGPWSHIEMHPKKGELPHEHDRVRHSGSLWDILATNGGWVTRVGWDDTAVKHSQIFSLSISTVSMHRHSHTHTHTQSL